MDKARLELAVRIVERTRMLLENLGFNQFVCYASDENAEPDSPNCVESLAGSFDFVHECSHVLHDKWNEAMESARKEEDGLPSVN